MSKPGELLAASFEILHRVAGILRPSDLAGYRNDQVYIYKR